MGALEAKQDISREGLKPQKIAHFLRIIFSGKATKVLNWSSSFKDIPFDTLFNDGKRGMILDVDECIAPHHGEILPENIAMIGELIKKGWKIVIFSNMKKSGRYQELEDLGIEVITSRYAKPDSRGFDECVEKLGMDRAQIVMIGDNFLTDGGSIGAGINFIKVDPIQTRDNNISISRMVQRSFRGVVDSIARRRNSINN